MPPVKRIWLGLFIALAGGYLAATWLVSGSIRMRVVLGGAGLISRATAPFGFWLLTGGAMAAAGIGICLAVVSASRLDSRADIKDDLQSMAVQMKEDHGLTQRKVLEYVGLFCILAVIYTMYLKGILDGPEELDLGRVGRFCLISAVPFGVLAFFDASWRSRDAAPIALGAWAVVFESVSMKYGGGCPPSAAFFFTPLVFSALVAHRMGAFRHPVKLSDG